MGPAFPWGVGLREHPHLSSSWIFYLRSEVKGAIVDRVMGGV